jgi:hypothetical protein
VTMFADVVPIDANLSCLIDGEVHGSYAIIEGGRELVFRRKTALPLQSGC